MMGQIINIDRSMPFDPRTICSGYSIWKGDPDGDGLRGEEEQDERSVLLTNLHFNRVRLIPAIRRGERFIEGRRVNGEERLRRLRLRSREEGFILADAKIFEILWRQKNLLKNWEKKADSYTLPRFSFDGTVLRCPARSRGIRMTLLMGYAEEWAMGVESLGNGQDDSYMSVVIDL